MAKNKFKIELIIEVDGTLRADELKYEIKNRLDDFTMYNEDDDEVEVSLPNFWEDSIVTPI